jgi:hypothetical protein
VRAAVARKRVHREESKRWVPRPVADDPLSDIVLSLFAADILEHPGEYPRSLRICDACDHVAWAGGAGAELLCRCAA